MDKEKEIAIALYSGVGAALVMFAHKYNINLINGNDSRAFQYALDHFRSVVGPDFPDPESFEFKVRDAVRESGPTLDSIKDDRHAFEGLLRIIGSTVAIEMMENKPLEVVAMFNEALKEGAVNETEEEAKGE